MNRKKAEAVLAAVNEKYAKWHEMSRELGYDKPDDFPQLVPNWHGWSLHGGKPVAFAITWECNSPDDWAMDWWNAQDKEIGVFCEPIFSFVLGIYDEDGFEWDRVKRGGKFVHQHLLSEDRDTPETCWITRVTRTPGGAVDTVWYRSGDPKVGYLNKASAEYFESSVVSFWED